MSFAPWVGPLLKRVSSCSLPTRARRISTRRSSRRHGVAHQRDAARSAHGSFAKGACRTQFPASVGHPRLGLPHAGKAVTAYQCVGDRILHTICCSRTMDLGLHIAVHARKKSFLRHTDIMSPDLLKPIPRGLPSSSTQLYNTDSFHFLLLPCFCSTHHFAGSSIHRKIE